jgi:hypothetical protein
LVSSYTSRGPRDELFGHPDRLARRWEHRVTVERGRARINETRHCCLARRRQQPARRLDVDRVEIRRAARREVGHVQRRRVHHRPDIGQQRREPRRVADVDELGGQRAGAPVDPDDLVAQRETGGDRAADPPRRARDEDPHGSRVANATRRPTRQVSS